MKTAVIYERVSSKEQEREGFSIPAQLRLLHDYAFRNGFSIVKEFVDIETAKTLEDYGSIVSSVSSRHQAASVVH